MNLKEPLTLPILFNPESTGQLKSLGIDVENKLEGLERRPVTFYTIDHIHPYFNEEGVEMTCIVSGGQEYICNDKVGVINREIINRMR